MSVVIWVLNNNPTCSLGFHFFVSTLYFLGRPSPTTVTKEKKPGWFKSLDGHVHVDDVEDLLEHSFE